MPIFFTNAVTGGTASTVNIVNIAGTTNETALVYLPLQTSISNSTNPITVTDQMFLPSGSGALYYHSITSQVATTLTQVAYNQLYTMQPPTRAPSPRPLARPALIAGRRALRRSITLFRMLRPESEIKTFLSGEPLIVQGHQFDYRLQKRNNLLHHSMNPNSAHIPYDLHILDKISGKSLARGCIVIPDTPVIDQVLALILHVQDPRGETKVIHTTNWTPDISAHLRRLPIAA
jgi:hypothetical protein